MRQLRFHESAKLLREFGIPFARFEMVSKRADVQDAARRVGFPLAMKILSPDIVHKTEAHAVEVGIRTPGAAEQTFLKFEERAKKLRARVEGVMLQRQASGIETIVGGKIDPQFGPVVVFGLGGIFVEVLKDVSLRVAPVSRRDALEMIQEVKGFPLLAGARGKPAASMDKLASVIVNVSCLLSRTPRIRELDLNPVFANTREAMPVDARIMVD
ncbi:acetate--CoA ligase family protein [Candidatus Micrarchaeota archaeon]|nr:acetate--CoA ligase family protein [Candidatus Micrarchaeota archaeon]